MKIEILNDKFDPWEAIVEYKRNDLQNNPSIGASSVFLGTVRDFNDDEKVESLFLEHYPEMTEKYLSQLVNEAIKKHKIIDGLVIHRVGNLKPTDPIVVVATWSEHRASAFDATRDIMESLKSEAPFWKKENNGKGFKWIKPADSSNIENEES
tara:strand:- start:1562 stop:2020 length:459 start_codon:yes stop_codon:yes gene_type:complete